MKKIRSICAIAILTLAFVLSGCGKQKEEGAVKSGDDEYIYVPEYQVLGGSGLQVSSAVIGNDQSVFYLESDGAEVKIVSLDMESHETTDLLVELAENKEIASLNSDGEGNLLYSVIGCSDMETGQLEEVVIKKMAPDGRELFSLDVSEIFLQQPDFYYITAVLMDEENNYYVCTGENIYVIKPDGSLYSHIDAGQYINSFFRMKNGKIVAAYFGAQGFLLNEVIPGQKELKPLDSSISFDYGTYQGGKDTDLLYTQDGILCSCNLTDEKPQEILRWTDFDVNSGNLTDVALLSDERIAAITTDYMSENGGTELVLLTRKKRSEVSEKKILTYGAFYLSFYAERDITAFNRQSQEYRIMVQEYGDASMSFDKKMEVYAKDLEAGNIPDIIDLTYCPMTLETLICVGAVEDLTPYLETDETIKKEDYIPNVLSAYERDGGLYAIMPCFGVEAFVGRADEIGEKKTWTTEDVITLLDSKEADTKLLPGADKWSILWIMCNRNQDMFIDKDSGACSFTGEEFKKILEFANRFPNEGNDDSTLDDLRNGRTLLNREVITSVQQYQMYEYMFGGPVNTIGYPSFGESGLTLKSNGTTVAMSAYSENKEGIWEFIRFNLSKERQENAGSPNGGFPILKSALEKQFEKDMEQEYIKDENGSQREMPKSTWMRSLGGEEFTVEVYAANEEQVARVREMIETAQNEESMNTEILNIISEEASGYFEGQKSVEDVAAVVQNRVQLYMNENN
ncbi:MAG: extracellular solute-binding protein [Lachnospiraceae bacterium]|nr:extracellular solute-binding protein [Lachnospiraceae bacterium]